MFKYLPFIIFAYLSMVAGSLSENIRGPLYMSLLEIFGLDHASGSSLLSVSAVGMVLGSLAAGQLLKYKSNLYVNNFGLILLGLGNVGAFFAPPYVYFLGLLGLASFGFGSLNVTQNSLVDEGASNSGRQRLIFILHTLYALSAGLAPLVFLQTTRLGGSPFLSFLIVAIIAGAAYFATYFHRQTNQKRAEDDLKPQILQAPVLLKRRTPILLGLGLGAYASGEILLGTRLPVLLQEGFSWSKQQSTLALTLFFFLFVGGRLVLVFKKIPVPPLRLIFISLLASLVTLALSYLASPWFLVATGLCMSAIFPAAVDHCAERFGASFPRSFSIVMTLVGVSIWFMQLASGYLHQNLGVRFLLGLDAVLVGLAIIFFFSSSVGELRKANR